MSGAIYIGCALHNERKMEVHMYSDGPYDYFLRVFIRPVFLEILTNYCVPTTMLYET